MAGHVGVCDFHGIGCSGFGVDYHEIVVVLVHSAHLRCNFYVAFGIDLCVEAGTASDEIFY